MLCPWRKLPQCLFWGSEARLHAAMAMVPLLLPVMPQANPAFDPRR